jgi:hypothetical protein
MEIYEPSLDKKNLEKTRKGFKMLFHARKDLDLGDEVIENLMQGLIDFHIHAAPDTASNRIYDEEDIAIRACEAGMKAVVFKCHSTPSSARAQLIQKNVNKWAKANGKQPVDIFSGVVLNYSVGGLNVEAVNTSAQLGGKFVWTPSKDSAHHHRVMGKEGGIEVLTDKDKVVPALRDIFEVIREQGLILGLSHHTVRERFILIEEARKCGIQKIVVNHPLGEINRATPEQILQMAEMGAFIGVTYVTSIPNLYSTEASREDMLEVFKLVGFDRIVGGTELTQAGNPHPVDGFKLWLRILLFLGVREEEVRKMFDKTPSLLLYQ